MVQTRTATGFGTGIYSPRDVARLIQVRTERVKRWTGGYAFKARDGRSGASRPVFESALEETESLTFLDLVETLFIKAFLSAGLSLQQIRAAAHEGAKEFGVRHPFCIKRFVTDGRRVFANLENTAHDERYVNVLSKQAEFAAVVKPLFKSLTYSVTADEIVEQWWPRGREVPIVVDPKVAFGAPVVSGRYVQTAILAAPILHGGETIEAVASWYDVPRAVVEAAVDFERQLATA